MVEGHEGQGLMGTCIESTVGICILESLIHLLNVVEIEGEGWVSGGRKGLCPF